MVYSNYLLLLLSSISLRTARSTSIEGMKECLALAAWRRSQGKGQSSSRLPCTCGLYLARHPLGTYNLILLTLGAGGVSPHDRRSSLCAPRRARRRARLRRARKLRYVQLLRRCPVQNRRVVVLHGDYRNGGVRRSVLLHVRRGLTDQHERCIWRNELLRLSRGPVGWN